MISIGANLRDDGGHEDTVAAEAVVRERKKGL